MMISVWRLNDFNPTLPRTGCHILTQVTIIIIIDFNSPIDQELLAI